MQIQYTSAVKTFAGWRSVSVVAQAASISKGMAQVTSVETIDGEVPNYNQSRTGAKRQAFNGLFWANNEVGKKKRISACRVLEV